MVGNIRGNSSTSPGGLVVRMWPFHGHGLSSIPGFIVVFIAESCSTLFDPMNYSLPGSSVHGIFQERILEWVVISSSRGSSQPRNWTHISCTGRQILLSLCHLGENGYMYMYGWVPSLFTITTLLISYTPIQTTKFKKKHTHKKTDLWLRKQKGGREG